MKKKIGVFIPATLGMLTAFGPFVTDFYLPVLPEMSEFFIHRQLWLRSV